MGKELKAARQARLAHFREVANGRIIRDAVTDLVKKGMTLDQIKRANPANGYRKQYGSDAGAWTTDMFVTAVDKGLTAKR